MKATTNIRIAAVILAAISLGGASTARADGIEVITAATGGETISADTAGGAWTTLIGPVITETKARDTGGPGLGTIVLNVPNGFEFNSDVPVSVIVTADFKKSINRIPDGDEIPVVVTRSNITITITDSSRGGLAWPDSITYQGIQVRPTAGYPLAVGDITESGTCDFRNLTLTSGTWGSLREVGGTLTGYQIIGTGSTTAGAPTTITIQKVDQYGNPLPDSTTETLIFSGLGSIGNYLPTINGSTDAFTAGIEVTFDINGTATVTLIGYKAETTTLNLSDGTASGGAGLTLTVDPGPVAALAFTSLPGGTTYGSPFSAAVQTIDLYGNLSTSGLGSSAMVSLGLSGGPGNLIGALVADIGGSSGNGSATFAGLQIDAAGNNYLLSANVPGLLSAAANLSVAQALVTPMVVVNNKVYDGTTDALIASRALLGVIGSDDVNLGLSGVANFANKHVGAAKLVTITGLALTGISAGNYQLTTPTTTATADITRRGVELVSTPHRKCYDGTVVSGELPNFAGGSLAAGDSATLSQAFADKVAGKGKLLIPSASIQDGNGGNNYSLAVVPQDNGEIDPSPLTVTAVPDTKVYDGTTSSAGIPIITSGTLVAGDTASFVQTFDTKNVGIGKTLTPAGMVNDGNGGNNYAVTFVNANAGTITAREITVTSVSDSKPYDGSSSSTGVPTVTSGSLAPGDTASFNQTFDGKEVGRDKPLSPGGTVNDGNGGGNYIITFVGSTGGSITTRTLTVSAAGTDKTYDGSTATTVTLSDNRVAGDNLSLSYASAAFANASASVGKPVSVTGITVGGADAGNYTYNTTAATTASITPAVLSVSADSQSRGFGAANPTLTGSLTGLVNGDNITANYSTDAKPDSPTGTYAIVPALNDQDGKLANYIVTLNNGTLTIGLGVSTTTVSTSLPVIVEGSSVTFTATVAPGATGVPAPTGNLQFLVNGTPLAAPVTLGNGVASLTTSSLTPGSNTVSAAYAGDASFSPSSGTTMQVVQKNIDTLRILSIERDAARIATVTFEGVPDTDYLVQATFSVEAPVSWTTIATNHSGFVDGQWTYVEDATQYPRRFFRAAKP
jgi:hypothetical protein